jgi:ATPase subunit of ABC transporter with duplicated ATPase domains
MITLKNISYGYYTEPLFENISFQIKRGDRICIVGENGAGKSTLMKIIKKDIESDEGVVHYDSGVRMLQVSQEFHAHELTIQQYILDHTKKVGPAIETAKSFGFDTEKFPIETTLCKQLSGGQQKALALSVAFVEEPDLLMLDEPENHLDIIARKHLIDRIKYFRGAILLISHDQTTLTTVVNRTIEIIDKTMYLTEGGYHDYVKARNTRVAAAERERKSMQKDLVDLQKSLVILHQKAFRGKATGDYRARKAEVAEMKETLKTTTPPSGSQAKKLSARISAEERSTQRFIWESKDLRYKYPETSHDAFRSEALDIRYGDRIGLVGRNGAGKTTFLNTICGKLTNTHGEMRWAPDATFELFNQHMHLPEDGQLVDVVRTDRNCNEEEAYRILGGAKLSSKAHATLRVKDLSGGQRMRLRFALAFSRPLDLLILDEPTNNLDESTLDILKDLIEEFPGALVIITHDRAFMEQIELHKFWYVTKHTLHETYKELDEIIKEMERDK